MREVIPTKTTHKMGIVGSQTQIVWDRQDVPTRRDQSPKYLHFTALPSTTSSISVFRSSKAGGRTEALLKLQCDMKHEANEAIIKRMTAFP